MTPRVRRLVARTFPDDADEVAERVEAASDDERVQAAILLASEGDPEQLRRLIELAALDWRDVLVAGRLETPAWELRMDVWLGPPDRRRRRH